MTTPTKYRRKPEPVEAVKLTAENAAAVAAWCGGSVFEEAKAGDPTDVRVWITFPTLVGAQELACGQFLVRGEDGKFTKVPDIAFTAVYEEIVEEAPGEEVPEEPSDTYLPTN